MNISWLAPELVGCLRAKLGAVAASSAKLRESDNASPDGEPETALADSDLEIAKAPEALARTPVYQDKVSNLKA